MDKKDEMVEVNLPIENKGIKAKLKKAKKKFTQALRIFNILFGILLLSSVLIFPYPSPRHIVQPLNQGNNTTLDSKTVYISVEDYRTVFKHYKPHMEEGFCMFGTINDTSIKVKKVLYAQTVISQTSTSITNMCMDEIKSQLPRMYTNYGYKFLGRIHTHPVSGEPHPSLRDIHSFGKISLFTELMAVGNNNTINFYTHDTLGHGVPVKTLQH